MTCNELFRYVWCSLNHNLELKRDGMESLQERFTSYYGKEPVKLESQRSVNHSY